MDGNVSQCNAILNRARTNAQKQLSLAQRQFNQDQGRKLCCREAIEKRKEVRRSDRPRPFSAMESGTKGSQYERPFDNIDAGGRWRGAVQLMDLGRHTAAGMTHNSKGNKGNGSEH